MKYIFSGDLENVCLELVDDADYTERRIAHLWSKAEFFQLTGILVPDYVELLSIEPDRDMMQDAPQFMQDIWNDRAKIKMHFKAAIMETRDEDGFVYHYDEGSDQIIQSDHPDKDHLLALRELNITKLGTRIVIDLIDILIQKGVIAEADLPSYFDLTTVKDLVSKVKWDEI
jgi:hypothetical protein